MKISTLKLSYLSSYSKIKLFGYKLILRAFLFTFTQKNPPEFLVKHRAKLNEQRAESNERGAKGNEQRAKMNEQRGKANEKRAKTKEQRATSKKFHLNKN